MVRLLPAAALALTLTPQLAAASVETLPVLTVFAPADGDDDVPTNTLVWLDETTAEFKGDTSELRLLGPEGDEVLLAKSSALTTPIGAVTVWQPERPLLADSRYVLWQCSQAACEYKLGEFRTRSGPAEDDPPAPVATELVERGDYLDTDAEFTGLLVVAAGEDDLDPDARKGELLAVGLPGEPIAFYAHQSINSVHLGTYDLAGNFSGFSAPLPVEREKSPVCGACNASQNPPVVLLMTLMLLGVRRRRPGAWSRARLSQVRRPPRP